MAVRKTEKTEGNSDTWVFDAHLDLAMNAMEWNRDLTCELEELRNRELKLNDKPDRGHGVVCFPEMRRGKIGMCVATLIARVEHDIYSPVFGWGSQEQAYAQTHGQWAWYEAMERRGEIRLIKDSGALNEVVADCDSGRETSSENKSPIGVILSLEGADSILDPDDLWEYWERGLRAIGPAHYGPGVYAQGTDTNGGFSLKGRELLQCMSEIGFILDVTHLSDLCFEEALDLYTGPIWASHSNCRKLVHHQRQLSDRQIRKLVQRDAVIGAALDGWMLAPDWRRGETMPESAGITLENWIDHMDHVNQIAGDADHVGIGSDLDGAFGYEQTPQGLKSIADLSRIEELLKRREYQDSEIDNMAHGNWVRFLRKSLPKSVSAEKNI